MELWKWNQLLHIEVWFNWFEHRTVNPGVKAQCRFKSCRLSILNVSLAPTVELGAVNAVVVGSNPTRDSCISGISASGSARALGAWGWRFESSIPD